MYSSKLNDRFIVAERKRTRGGDRHRGLPAHPLQKLPQTSLRVSGTLMRVSGTLMRVSGTLMQVSGTLMRVSRTLMRASRTLMDRSDGPRSRRVYVCVANGLQPIRCAADAVRLDTLRKTRD